ncbi:hypothetical protein EDB80DRAFT_839204 [Ilyonectria destructans]|nr:hypothetical protein EDB80DRAFT_839204 [Ilyonectria destructans]
MSRPTAEMPMPGGRQQKELLDALNNHKSLYELSLELPKLAKSLASNTELQGQGFDVAATVAAIDNDKANCWAMLKLLHSMDPSVIRAIIQGTVAYDTHHGNAKWFKTPEDTEGMIPGVYAVGLSRVGCDGKFLNIDETKKLVRGLEKYVDGFRILRNHRVDVEAGRAQVGVMSPSDAELVEWIAKVDGHPVTVVPGCTLPKGNFIEEESEVPGIEALTFMFGGCCCLVSRDPTEQIRQIQSPIYIGCSTDLKMRMSQYLDPALPRLNKPMSLTVSTLGALGLPVTEKDQLPLAEQLLTTLACSLVYQHGFNDTEAGGTDPSTIKYKSLDITRDMIMAHTDTMKTNLENTLDEMDRRVNFLETTHSLKAKLAELNADCDRAVDLTKQAIAAQTLSWEDMQKLMKEMEEEMRQRLAEAEEIRKQCVVVRKITRIMKG